MPNESDVLIRKITVEYWKVQSNFPSLPKIKRVELDETFLKNGEKLEARKVYILD